MKPPTICMGPGPCPHDACNRELEEQLRVANAYAAKCEARLALAQLPKPEGEKERAETRLRDLRSWHGGNVPACEPDRSAYADALRIAGEGNKDGV